MNLVVYIHQQEASTRTYVIQEEFNITADKEFKGFSWTFAKRKMLRSLMLFWKNVQSIYYTPRTIWERHFTPHWYFHSPLTRENINVCS